MSYELKKVKIVDELSEETMCFSAQIWEDGKHVADVSNRGYGGCNDVYVKEMDDKYQRQVLRDKYEALEVEIEEMAIDFDTVRRLQGKHLVIKKDDKTFTVKYPMAITKLKKHPQYQEWIKKHSNGYRILNTNL
jgi:glycine betaine/choline ABC-type transport system substrate-binding protein